MPGRPKIVITPSAGERDLKLLMQDVWQGGPVNPSQAVEIKRIFAADDGRDAMYITAGYGSLLLSDARTGWELLVALATYMAELHRHNGGAPLSDTYAVSPYNPEGMRGQNVDIDERLR